MLPDTSYTYYEVLQTSPDAPPEHLRAAYRAAVRRAHPDQGGHPLMFRMVQAAWQVLSDPRTRAEYDALMRSGTAPTLGGHLDVDVDLVLAPTAHPKTGRPYGLLANSSNPRLLQPGAWITVGAPGGRTTAHVRAKDHVEVHVDVPPHPLSGRMLLAAPVLGPESIPLLHGRIAADGRTASVPRSGLPPAGEPELGRRVVVATERSWVAGTVQDVVTTPGDELIWVAALWTWDLEP